MDMYTMNANFVADDVVDEFISAIWTERYAAAGELQLVTAPTPTLIDKLAEGTFVGLRGSTEIMRIHTQSIEKHTLTIVGSSLVQFFDERLFWNKNPASSPAAEERVKDLEKTGKVGKIISDAVDAMVINTVPFSGTGFTEANLQWEADEIPFLELGDIDLSGADEKVTITVGPLYTAIQQVAAKFGVGFQLYLEYGTLEGYLLKFRTYRGQNRTTVNSNKTGTGTFPNNVTDPPADVSWGKQLVRLVPDMDSLSDVKEIRSIAFHKNVAYVYYKGKISVHYEDPAAIPTGWDRRVLMVNAEGEPPMRKPHAPMRPLGMFGGSSGGAGGGGSSGGAMVGWVNSRFANTGYTDSAEILAFREQQAKDALANHNYVKAVDGQTSPHNDYKFGKDYGLGDLIELQGLTGTLSKARVTEYIRSQDRTGEREYPTISVI